ncbi:hypothetical protein ACEZ7K_004727 [Salmonella enterica]|nr:hypothetical protein [Salmonella enterica subsp. enterica serovar Saintpaul]
MTTSMGGYIVLAGERVSNSGSVTTPPGKVGSAAKGQDILLNTVVNNSGTVEAKGLASRGDCPQRQRQWDVESNLSTVGRQPVRDNHSERVESQPCRQCDLSSREDRERRSLCSRWLVNGMALVVRG